MSSAASSSLLAPPSAAIRFRGYELGFAALGLVSGAALLLRGSDAARGAVEAFAGTALYVFLLGATARFESPRAQARGRLAVNYLFCLWFYGASTRIALALGIPTVDAGLLAFDEACFRRTPAFALEAGQTSGLTELLSGCYLSYLVYLHVVLGHALTRPAGDMARLSRLLFAGFFAGFIGYLLVPALGPGAAFPERFTAPLTGGVLASLNASVIARGAAALGSFPSLHVLNTLLLLEYDRHVCPLRFQLMLVPAVGLAFSTLYLRQHYAADVLAAAVLFLVLRRGTAR